MRNSLIKLYEINNIKGNQKGVTLIVLAVTIIVLIILAGVTVSFVIGDNGIVNKAQQAANKAEEVGETQKEEAQNLLGQMNEMFTEKEEGVTLKSLMTTVSDKNEVVYDKYGNKIVVPAGFKVKKHTGTGLSDITYTYDKVSGASTNIPVV